MIKPVTLLTTRDVESIEGIIWDGAVHRAFASEIPRNEYLRVRWHPDQRHDRHAILRRDYGQFDRCRNPAAAAPIRATPTAR